MASVLSLPKYAKRKEQESAREPHRCPVCDWPSATRNGSRIHHTLSHGNNSCAERNWHVFDQYFNEEASVANLARTYHLTEASIRRIVQRGLLYPYVYDLDPELE